MGKQVYYQDDLIVIRDMEQSDAQIITNEEIAQGWNQTIEKYLRRLQDQEAGVAIPLVAEYKGFVAGYISIYPDSKNGAFANQGIPEIVDLGVLEKYRNLGIGNKLMDVAEMLVAQTSDRVYLGVGLHQGYGNAQRLYVKRGYVPDGSGVWYRNSICPPYSDCNNNDNLVLYLSKDLTETIYALLQELDELYNDDDELFLD